MWRLLGFVVVPFTFFWGEKGWCIHALIMREGGKKYTFGGSAPNLLRYLPVAWNSAGPSKNESESCKHEVIFGRDPSRHPPVRPPRVCGSYLPPGHPTRSLCRLTSAFGGVRPGKHCRVFPCGPPQNLNDPTSRPDVGPDRTQLHNIRGATSRGMTGGFLASFFVMHCTPVQTAFSPILFWEKARFHARIWEDTPT